MMDLHAIPVEPEFDFIGGNLCLDFANTWGGLPADSITQERLTTYPELVAWTQHANLINASEAELLLHKAESAYRETSAILERAITIRESIRDIFLAVAQTRPVSESDLALLNSELERGMSSLQLIITLDGFALEWRKEAGAFDQMLAPIARSAAMLLISAELPRVRKCANQQCRWLFVDTTKNHSRQWCKTNGCGNLMRVRKHREQQRSKD